MTTPVAKRNLSYTGSALALVTPGSVNVGTMQYALGTATAATGPYTTSIPTKTNVGTYYVWYKVIGDSNHLDSEPGMVETAIIAPVFGTPNFTLPAGVGTIEANAFEGLKNMNVVDARNCKKIGAEAFKGTGLKQIRLDKDCEIAENAFSGCGMVYVFAQTGGKTKTFCDTHEGIVFVAVE